MYIHLFNRSLIIQLHVIFFQMLPIIKIQTWVILFREIITGLVCFCVVKINDLTMFLYKFTVHNNGVTFNRGLSIFLNKVFPCIWTYLVDFSIKHVPWSTPSGVFYRVLKKCFVLNVTNTGKAGKEVCTHHTYYLLLFYLNTINFQSIHCNHRLFLSDFHRNFYILIPLFCIIVFTQNNLL